MQGKLESMEESKNKSLIINKHYNELKVLLEEEENILIELQATQTTGIDETFKINTKEKDFIRVLELWDFKKSNK